MNKRTNLYRVHYFPGAGYAVYRHCFDETKCDRDAGIIQHTVADFIARDAAEHYAAIRNRMIDENGDDALPR